MAFIEEKDFDRIRESANIVDIVASYVPLNKSGNDYVGVCPFHEDHSPSMHVSTKLGIFKCFVCNTGGNVFSFVQRYENVSFLEAVKIVANKSGIKLDYDINPVFSGKNKKEFEIMDLSLKFFQNNLVSSKGLDAVKYLASRAIKDEMITNFKFGLSLNNNSLLNFLKKHDCDLEVASNIGLINKNGIDYYDVFVDRIMIPIFDSQGRLSGYTARSYLKDEKNKYINSKETVIYKKSNILFNYYKAKDSARLKKELIVVEGNMDAITASVFGFDNIVALMGVVISPFQIDLIKRLNVRVVLMLDNDNAGALATLKVGEELYKAGVDLYVSRLNGAKDPDEYLRKYGKEEFENIVKHASKYFDYKLSYLRQDRDLSNASDVTMYVEDVLKAIENASDIEREVVIAKLSNEFGIDATLLKQKAPVREIKNISSPVLPPQKKRKSRYELAVIELIAAMLTNKRYYNIYLEKLGYLKEKVERQTVQLIGQYIDSKGNIDVSGYLDFILKYDDVSLYVNENILRNLRETIAEKEFYDILYTVCKCIDEDEIKNLRIKIKEEVDINRKIELIEKLTKLKKGCGNYERN